jgi:serine protease AprX
MKNKFSTLLLGAALSFQGFTALAQATVDPALKAVFATKPVAQVVVTFNGTGAPTLPELSLLRQLGITQGVSFKALPIAGIVATASQVAALAQRPEVKSVFYNKQLSYYDYEGNNLTGVRRLRLDQQITARNNGTPVSGRGIGVLINDSGVDGTHDDIKYGTHLAQNTLGSTNLNSLSALLPVTYIEGVPNTDNNSGHGTHCAGIVGGNGTHSNGKYEGVAPGATLLGYGSGGALLVLDAIGGFDYALTHQFQYNIRVISNSFGSSGAFDPTDPLNVASKQAFDRGMVIVFAAGNSGPGADTHNPYAIAPWTISVGAGDKNGLLADFSSRGVKNEKGTFTMDGQTYNYENKPVITAPGVDIVSTRALGPVAALGIQTDQANLTAAELPYYTYMSGTSMATPHVAGVVALLLEAKPSLSPLQVRSIIEKTATNMPGREPWEVGAGYINAYAAVDMAQRGGNFGSTVNMTRKFNSNVNSTSSVQNFTVNYNPATTATNQFPFNVAAGTNSIEAKITVGGLLGQTGNVINLILVEPNGTEHRSGIPVEFTLTPDRSVSVAAPAPGTWTLQVAGLDGAALPDTIPGKITQLMASGTSGMADIAGNPAEPSIIMAVNSRLVDGLSTGYKPNDPLTRMQLADYLTMGQGVRQYFPTAGTVTYSDVTGTNVLLAEAVSATGAALRDRYFQANGVMLPTATGTFSPNAAVNRASLAYSLVQALGFQANALARNGKPVTMTVNGQSIPVDDASKIPAGLEGYVSVALELNLINAYYSVSQGPYDLQPTVHATFKPSQTVTRGDFAVIVTRTFAQYDALTQPAAVSAAVAAKGATTDAAGQSTETVAYPNPFSGSTTVNYYLAQDGPVSVEVYNTMGAKVRTLVVGTETAGSHQVQFDAGNLSRGTYLFQVKTGETVSTKRVVLQ